jgi:hypothetical protein
LAGGCAAAAVLPLPDSASALPVTDVRRSSWRIAVAITLVAGLARLIVAALTPLFPDETYYWEWSRHLAPGYFDHPPMIALLVRAGVLVAGDTALGVRIGCVVAGVVAALVLSAAARRIRGDEAAVVTAIVFALMPLAAAGLVLATPDAPLLAASAGVTYAVIRIVQSPAGSAASLRWWCVAGVLLGVAFLSKYTAVLIPLGVVVAFLLMKEQRRRFAEIGPYAATGIALLVFLPVVLWNARHDWASFAFQLQHGLSGGLGSALSREAEMVGGQVGLVSPILFVMSVVAVVEVVRSRQSGDEPRVRTVLAVMSMAVFAFFVYSATRRRVEANWPALTYLPGVILLATRDTSLTWRRWLRAGYVTAAVISAVAYVNAFTPILPIPAPRDPAARAAGWDDLARATAAVLHDTSAHSERRTFIAANRYQDASELAFHMDGNPAVMSLNLATRPNQYDFWPGFPERANAGDALVVVVDDGDRHPAIDSLASHFIDVAPVGASALARNGDVIKRMRIWRLSEWRGTWPRSQLRSRP